MIEKMLHRPAMAICVCLIFSSCSADISQDDEALKRLIIGTFSSENYETISFNRNGTFTDTLWNRLPYSKTKELVPIYAAGGGYVIKDGRVYFSDVRFTYVKAAYDRSVQNFAEIFFPRIIRQDNEDLFFIQPITELEGEGESLAGEWLTENWIAVFDKNKETKYEGGMIKETFNFTEGNLCIYSLEFLFESSLKDTGFTTRYDYDHPRIYFHAPELEIPTFRGSLIQFREGKMYWYHSDPILFEKLK